MLFLVLSVAICLGGWWFISYTDRRDMEEAEREAHKHVCGKVSSSSASRALIASVAFSTKYLTSLSI